MKLHYFLQERADADDAKLAQAIEQGKVPSTCLAGGVIVMIAVAAELDPCSGCNGPRERCGGREKQEDSSSGIIRDLLQDGLGAPSKAKLPI